MLRRFRDRAAGRRSAPPRRRRDRHGRGVRGPLALASPLAPEAPPLQGSRADRFDALVLDAVTAIHHAAEPSVAAALAAVDVTVEAVPPHRPDEATGGPGESDPVPLGRADAATRTRHAQLVVYRRPVELRAQDGAERAALVRDVVAEQLADLLGLTPEQVDPGYRGLGD